MLQGSSTAWSRELRFMKSSETHPVSEIISLHESGSIRGIYSVCSSNELVLEAAFAQAREDGSHLLVESTCNQVNQYGGYTGMTPASFAEYMGKMAERKGFPREKLILGGDHLGPNVWKDEPAEKAMEKAGRLVMEYAEAGFSKIHLDASAPCAGDPRPLPDEVVAERSADLCRVVEEAKAGALMPVYVVGTEVPVPGGVQEQDEGLKITGPAEAEATIENARKAFAGRGLEDAWERVKALVVQPGVEFGNAFIIDYDRDKAADLSSFINEYPGMTFEAHSTDYQKKRALREMVEDNFTILKVGPWLTFALREGLMALECIEREMISALRRRIEPSGLASALDAEMAANPVYWEKYYPGNSGEQALQRKYSFSDRVRYYWQRPDVEKAVDQLFANLDSMKVPISLLSQYLPHQYLAVREERLELSSREIALDKIREVLRLYSYACI